MQAFYIALGYPPELKRKTLKLRILHTWVKEHGRDEAGKNLDALHHWLTFTVLEDAMMKEKTDKDQSYSTRILQITIMTGLARHTDWCNRCKHILRVTKHFLIRFKSYFHWKKPIPGSFIGLRTKTYIGWTA